MLGAVLRERRSLSDQTDDPDGAYARLAPADRAQALRLVAGCLRNFDIIEHGLAPRLRKPPPAAVMDVLRIAAFEAYSESAAPYALADSAVRLVQRMTKHKHLSGLVNGVLRGLLRDGPEAWADAPAPVLPGWLDRPVRTAWGPGAATAIAAAHRIPPPVDLTPRDPDTAAALADELGATLLPTGSLRLAGPVPQLSTLPGFAEGAWWVQDAAAALPVRMLGDLRGARVLDLCAAPGGKTMQLAAAGAQVTALDISESRLVRLRQNLDRTGLEAEVIVADALDWHPQAPFDAVLLDAPCSATGTLRRHPDLPFLRPDPDLAPLLTLQEALIDRALAWLVPGGLMLYATCSLLPAEGEGQASAALARHPGLAPAGLPPPAGVAPDWLTADGSLRLRPDFWPESGGMDGFFATIWRKPGHGG